jgi:hypothetical protein
MCLCLQLHLLMHTVVVDGENTSNDHQHGVLVQARLSDFEPKLVVNCVTTGYSGTSSEGSISVQRELLKLL